MTPVRKRSRAALVALAVTAVVAPTARAVEGGLYPVGGPKPSVQNGGGLGTNGSPWLIRLPGLDPARAGEVARFGWGCPVGGSEIAQVSFGGLRLRAASHMELRVLGNGGGVVWREGDALMPQSPEPGRAYHIALPGGQCDVALVLHQVATLRQHERSYYIDNPRILVRDLTPPSVAIRGVTPGWLRGGGFRVDWSVADNFGSDGIGQQRVVVAGQVRWAGAPGQGDHGVDIDLGGIPDGVHAVDVQADGDGTPPGGAAATVRVDRTAPSAQQLTTSIGPPGRASFSWTASDNVSGVVASHVEVNAAPDGSTGGEWRTVASAPGGGPHAVADVRVD
ncbi:MAG: hypothetical protein K2X91_01545, partial [Thermoleophilia bacterium]|nr:hypothetical protein [Thermoleophilia bacterium]